MNRWLDVSLVAVGVVLGVVVAGLAHGQVSALSAQGTWQCQSWTLESKDSADPVGSWLGAAARVEIATASLPVAGRYALVACKQ